MRVLIVDDEARYRVYLKSMLSRRRHDVAVASNGREAIDQGLRFPTDVLVTDWMLKNHHHGIHIAAALQTVNPDTRTILITGFASDDLRAQAKAARIELIEKPFAPEELANAVESAAVVPTYLRPRVPFGVIVAAPNGVILHASPRALEMLASTSAAQARRVESIFGSDAPALIEQCCDDFCEVAPNAPVRVRWWLGARRIPEATTLVLLPERKRFLRFDPSVMLLLDRGLPGAGGRQIQMKVLVVDDIPADQASYMARLEGAGCLCYKAPDSKLAARILHEEPEIDVVVIDQEAVGPDLGAVVDSLRSVRPSVAFVGVSTALRSEFAFNAVGVEHFLRKPWSVGNLFHILNGEA